MATTSYGVNDAETVKLWSRKLFREALNRTFLRRFIGEDSSSLIQMQDETGKGAGDRVRVLLRTQLDDLGISGDSTLEGQEEALVTHTDDLLIDQLRHAVRSRGRMTEQRVPFSIRNEARMSLEDWWADRIDQSLFNQLGGVTADTRLTGLNASVAYDTSHIVWPSTAGTQTEAALNTDSASGTMTLTDIDTLVETAKTATYPIRPLSVGGESYFVMFIHPFQAHDLRTNTGTGQWLDIQKAVAQGGRISDNPIFTGALGVYNQTILHESVRVPASAAQSGVRRAIFCGAQAAVVAFGRDNGPNVMTWNEELFDYGNQLGVSAGMIWGAKRSIFNNLAHASAILPTHAKSHG